MGPVASPWRTRSAVTLVVVFALGLAWVGAATRVAVASAHGNGTLPAPHLISLTYGRYRPQGAPHAYLALRLRALEPNGQVVATQFETSDGGTAVGDGGCDLGGRRNGQVAVFYMPFKLSPGRHEVTVTATGSACSSSTKTRTATRTFRVTVR